MTVYTLFFAPIHFINLMLFNSNNESKESWAKSCFKSKMLQKNSVQENKTRAVSDLAGDSIKKLHVVTLQNTLNLCSILTLF